MASVCLHICMPPCLHYLLFPSVSVFLAGLLNITPSFVQSQWDTLLIALGISPAAQLYRPLLLIIVVLLSKPNCSTYAELASRL